MSIDILLNVDDATSGAIPPIYKKKGAPPPPPPPKVPPEKD